MGLRRRYLIAARLKMAKCEMSFLQPALPLIDCQIREEGVWTDIVTNDGVEVRCLIQRRATMESGKLRNKVWGRKIEEIQSAERWMKGGKRNSNSNRKRRIGEFNATGRKRGRKINDKWG